MIRRSRNRGRVVFAPTARLLRQSGLKPDVLAGHEASFKRCGSLFNIDPRAELNRLPTHGYWAVAGDDKAAVYFLRCSSVMALAK